MKHILFDLDGTLLDTGRGIVKSIQYALKSVGIDIEDLKSLEKHIGPPLKEGFEAFYGFDHEKSEMAVSKFRERYKEIGLLETIPYEGIEECLKALSQQEVKLYVATSKPEVIAKEFLEHFGLSSFFIDICGSTFDHTISTKADVIRYLMEKNNLSIIDDITMVGDREQDVLGANEVGIPSIGVLYGFGSRHELQAAGANYIAKTPEEVVQVILGDTKGIQ